MNVLCGLIGPARSTQGLQNFQGVLLDESAYEVLTSSCLCLGR